MSDEYKIVQIRDADGRLEWQMTVQKAAAVVGGSGDMSVVVMQHVVERGAQGRNSLRVLRRTPGGGFMVVNANVPGSATLGAIKKAAELSDEFITPFGVVAAVVLLSKEDLESLTVEDGKKYSAGLDLRSGNTAMLGIVDGIQLVLAGNDLQEWIDEWISDDQ